MPITKVQAPDGSVIKVEHPEGASQDGIVAFAQSQYKKDEPGVGEIGAGLVSEVAIGEGAKYAATTAGALVGGPVGAGIGYFAGGLAGGISGSIAAQKIEGRDDISWGRVTADTLLNLMPFGTGKAAKGSKVLPRIAKAAAARGVAGAGISAGAMQVEKGIEEGELLTPDELLVSAGIGAGLGVGLGALGGALSKSYGKLRGKTTDEISEAYNKGDHDAITVVDSITGGNPNGRTTRYGRMIGQYIAPSMVIGNRTSKEVRDALNMAKTASDIGAKAQKRIDNIYNKLDPNEQKLVDDYLEGSSTALPPRAQELKEAIDESRQLISEYQDKIINLYDQGYLDMNPMIIKKIEDSQIQGNYLTRNYKFFEDSKFEPSQQQTNLLRNRLIKDGSTAEQADKFILDLNRSRAKKDSVNALGMIAGSGKKILKRRKYGDDMPKELQDFLGYVREPGERVFSTMSSLGKLAAIEQGKANISQMLLKSGLAKRGASSANIPGMVRLSIRGDIVDSAKTRMIGTTKTGKLKDVSLEGEEIYVPREVQKSIDNMFSADVPRDTATITENFFTRALSTTTGMAKFARVPLSVAAYPVQVFGNMAMVLGQGMNPFRGYRRGMQVAGAEIRNKKFSLKEMEEYKRLGLVDKDVTGSDLRASINSGYGPRLAKGVVNKVGKLYSFFDTAQRVSVFENYKKMLTKMNPNAEAQLGTRRFNELAAEMTNSTYQNYDRINPSLRYLSRIGVLNEFVSFNLELMRTTFNQMRLAKNMLDGNFAKKIKGEYGLDLDGAALRNEGLRRVAGMTAMLATATAGITTANKARGIGEEEEEALRDVVVPDWDRNSKLLFDRNGDKVGMSNISYQIPAAELTSIVEAALRGDSFTDAVGKGTQSMVDKFFGGGTINMKNVVNTLQNRDPQTGRIISTSPNAMEKLFDLGTYYVSETFTPGFVRDIQKLDERTGKELGARYLLGQRKMNSTIQDGAGFKLRDAKERVRALRIGYSSSLYNEKADASAMYNKFNSDYRANAKYVMDKVNSLRVLGKNEQQIRDILKKSQVDKNIVENVLVGQIPNMRIAVGISGTKAERVRKYADIFKRLPRELGIEMLNQEARDKKINMPTLLTIKRLIEVGG